MGGSLQHKDIPPGGPDVHFVVPGLQPIQWNHANFQAPQQQLDNGIPNLNLEPQPQEPVEEIMNQDEPEPAVQEPDQQEEMDIQLHLSPPLEFGSSVAQNSLFHDQSNEVIPLGPADIENLAPELGNIDGMELDNQPVAEAEGDVVLNGQVELPA